MNRPAAVQTSPAVQPEADGVPAPVTAALEWPPDAGRPSAPT